MAKTKKSSIRTWRRIVLATVFFSAAVGLALHAGWGTISSMGYKAIAWVCPLGFLESLVATWTGAPRAIIVFVCIVLLTVVFGRAFCSWICPVPPIISFFHPEKKPAKAGGEEGEAGREGVVAEAAAEVAGAEAATAAALVEAEAAAEAEVVSETYGHHCSSCAARSALAPVGGKRDGFRFDSRHWVLIAALLTAAIFGFPVFCLVCPVGLTFATLICVWSLFETHVLTWGVLVFPAIIALEVVVFRKWCHTLCPLGALFSLISQANRTFRPSVNAGRCEVGQ